MNGRIKQLALQAGFRFDTVTGFAMISPDADPEKFAELIIQECINEIHGADVGDLLGKSYYLDKIAEHIEKHFGVE